MITAGAAVLPGTGRMPTMTPTAAGHCRGKFFVAAALCAANHLIQRATEWRGYTERLRLFQNCSSKTRCGRSGR